MKENGGLWSCRIGPRSPFSCTRRFVLLKRIVLLSGTSGFPDLNEAIIVLPPQTFTGKLDVMLVAPKGGGTYSLDLTGNL